MALVCLLLAGSPAAAQESPRRGRLLALSGESAGVWLSGDRVFGPSGEFLSACVAGAGCAPVIETWTCAPPSCPGSGAVHRVDRSIAHVPDWPVDVDGYERERELLSADPAIVGLLSTHPEYSDWVARRDARARADERERMRHAEPVRWVSDHREDGERFELGLSGAVATLVETPGTWLGGTASLGLVYYVDADAAEDEDDEFLLNFFAGDVMGVEARAHFLYRADGGQEAEWITAIGMRPVFANRVADTVVRAPTYLGLLLPEFGVILRPDRAATWYAAWEAPVSFLVGHDVAVDVAARVFVIDEWVELATDAPEDAEDPAEVVLMLSAGVRVP